MGSGPVPRIAISSDKVQWLYCQRWQIKFEDKMKNWFQDDATLKNLPLLYSLSFSLKIMMKYKNKIREYNNTSRIYYYSALFFTNKQSIFGKGVYYVTLIDKTWIYFNPKDRVL